MIRKVLALLRTSVLAAFVPVLSLGLVSCVPDNGGSTVAPEVSVPDGYVNYFIEDLSLSRSVGEVKVAFQINVDWTMQVVAPEGTSSFWLSVEPASGAAGLHKVMVRVTDNDTYESRAGKIHLYHGNSKIAEIVVTQDGILYEAVDLGLSVKWASCNIGATSPEDYGGYYAWGETEEKSNYSWSTYKWCNGSYDTMTKYCTDSYYGTVDNNTTLDLSDDVAHVKWGGSWRMPTLDEINELINDCSWSWTTQNGVNGCKVTGPNGNSIFLPAAGYRDDDYVYGRGSHGRCWSSSLYSSYSDYAYYLYFDSSIHDWDYRNRYYGHTVRPVTE